MLRVYDTAKARGHTNNYYNSYGEQVLRLNRPAASAVRYFDQIVELDHESIYTMTYNLAIY